ncbi:MAG: hypothetical protein L3J47_12775, partial [Sulfurovum sp.]|nr:hypothetical protein [Sulfurovum sp.]
MKRSVEQVVASTLFNVVGFSMLMLYIFSSPVIAALLLTYADAPQQLSLFIPTDLLLLLAPLSLWLYIGNR